MASVYCRACGAPVTGQARFCENCGAEILRDRSTAAFCPDGSETCKLKKLLVIILGCTACMMTVAWQLSNSTFWFDCLCITGIVAMYGAMVLHHVLKGRTVPIILAVVSLVFEVFEPLAISLLFNIPFFELLRSNWFSYTACCLMAVLLLLYTILGKKTRDHIVWFIVFLALYAVSLTQGAFFDVFSVIYLLHTVAFFSIGYSPDKWWRRRGAGIR